MPSRTARFRLVLHWPSNASETLAEAVRLAREAADFGRLPHNDLLLRLPPKTRAVVRGLASEGEDFGIAVARHGNGTAPRLVLTDDNGRFCPRPTADLLAAVMRDYDLVGSIAATWSEQDATSANGPYETGGGFVVTANARKVFHLDDVLHEARAALDPDYFAEESAAQPMP